MTSRRGFLSLISLTAASAVLDPERALWVPGKKLISIPSVRTPALDERLLGKMTMIYMKPAINELALQMTRDLLDRYDLMARYGGWPNAYITKPFPEPTKSPY